MRTKKKYIVAGLAVLLLLAVCAGLYIYISVEKEPEEPYFTDAKLSADEMGELVYHYHFSCEPEFSDYLEDYAENKDPDYSDYKLAPDELTEMTIAVLNYALFVEAWEEDAGAISYAEKSGLSSDNPITSEWVLENPREAIAILNKTFDEGAAFYSTRYITERYSIINQEG